MSVKETTYTLKEVEDIWEEANFFLTTNKDTGDLTISFGEDADEVGAFTKVGEDAYTFRWYKP